MGWYQDIFRDRATYTNYKLLINMDSYATFRLLVRHESPKSPASRGAFLFYPPTCRPMMALRIECRVRCTYQIWGWQDRHFPVLIVVFTIDWYTLAGRVEAALRTTTA